MRLSPVKDVLEVNDSEVLFLHLTHALFGGAQLSLAETQIARAVLAPVIVISVDGVV